MDTNPTLKGANNFRRVAAWFDAAGKKRNGITMSTQSGVMLEEITELLNEMTISSSSGVASVLVTEASRLLKEVADQLKTGEAFCYFYDRKEALDAMVDVEVTINGVAHLGGFEKERADTKVIDSLFDKFLPDGTPVIKPGGKIGKRPGWVAPDLSDCVGELTQPDEEDQPFHPYMSAARWVQEFRRQNPDVVIDDGIVNQLVMQAVLVGAEIERARHEVIDGILVPGGIAEAVSEINAATEAGSNSISSSSDNGA